MTDREKCLNQWVQEQLAGLDYRMELASSDASFRRYFRVFSEERTYILMDAPPESENCGPFIKVSARLIAAGLNAPHVIAHDSSKGFLLLDDLGETLYLDIINHDNADRLYGDAIEALIRMQHEAEWIDLPPYDQSLLIQEMNLFSDWLLLRHLELNLTETDKTRLKRVFDVLVENAIAQPVCFVHRDYHSRNLLVTPVNNPGILDFQDAVRGPVSYDLVSLLKDCYIKWPKSRILHWAEAYYHGKGHTDCSLDQFIEWFDLMGVQRHLKASGIFARLWHRDCKQGYLKDIPRTLSYIVDLGPDYPVVRPLADLISQCVLPLLIKKDPACAP